MIELTVADLARSLAWYRDRLGLAVTLVDEPHGFALLQSGTTRLSLKQGEPVVGSAKIFFQVRELRTYLEHLAQGGVVPNGPLKTSHEGYRRALLTDPDGYTIGLFEWDASLSSP